MSHKAVNERDDKRIDVVVHGIPGYAEASISGWGFNAKWASHTGYKHTFVQSTSQNDLEKVGLSLFEDQSPLCYLVGDEHKNFGWKKIRINMNGLVETRIPQWADEEIKSALLDVGLKESCSLNCFWVFNQDVTIECAKQLSAPLLKPSTRLADESILAAEIRKSFLSSELKFNQSQLSLF